MAEEPYTTSDATIWRDSPSQWKEWPGYLGAGLLLVSMVGLTVVSRTAAWPGWTTWAFVIAEAVPVLAIAWLFAKVATVQFELTGERLRETTGVVSRNLEEVELYRVKDINVKRSPLQLALGAATITLHTSDTTRPTLALPWVKGFREKHETIRAHVEQCRLKNRSRVSRGIDFEGDDADDDLV